MQLHSNARLHIVTLSFRMALQFSVNPLSQRFYFRFLFRCSFSSLFFRYHREVGSLWTHIHQPFNTVANSHIDVNSVRVTYSISIQNASTVRTEFENRSMHLIAHHCYIYCLVLDSGRFYGIYTMRSMLVLDSRYAFYSYTLIDTNARYFIRNRCFRCFSLCYRVTLTLHVFV